MHHPVAIRGLPQEVGAGAGLLAHGQFEIIRRRIGKVECNAVNNEPANKDFRTVGIIPEARCAVPSYIAMVTFRTNPRVYLTGKLSIPKVFENARVGRQIDPEGHESLLSRS